MQIIPVIDLKNGIVVHAKQGDREHYAPLASRLCPGADAVDLVGAFVGLFDFKTVYIADLDAITGQGENFALIGAVMESFPGITFWLDCGYPLPATAQLPRTNYLPVVGSENLAEKDLPELADLNGHFVLSLDYDRHGAMGTELIYTTSSLWPEHVIIMTLGKVGSGRGPDFGLLGHYASNFPSQSLVAAGGIRNSGDVHKLTALGIRHCLIASALHDGNITATEIASLQAKKYPDERGIFVAD